MPCRDLEAHDNDSLKAIGKLYSRVFPQRELDLKDFSLCAKQFSGAVCLLEEDQEVFGVARCLPIREPVYDLILTSRRGVRPFIVPQNVLGDDRIKDNVIGGIGNSCFVGMVVWDPRRNVESYRQHAMALFHHLRNKFYRVRANRIVSQSETPAEAKALKDLGCRWVYGMDKGDTRGVWRFDVSCIDSGKPITSLGDVFEELWLTRPRLWDRIKDKDLLTRKERQVLTSLMLEGHQHDAADLLKMPYATFRVHLDRIRRKCDQLVDVFPKKPTTNDILKHCFENQIEFRVPTKQSDKNAH